MVEQLPLKREISIIERTEKITKFFLFCNIIFLFMGFMFPESSSVWKVFLFSVDLIYIYFKVNVKIQMNMQKVFWILFCIAVLIGNFQATDISAAMMFFFTLILFFMNYVLLEVSNNWRELFMKLLTYIVSFFILGSIIQIFFPNLIMQLQPYYLNAMDIGTAQSFVLRGQLVGFSNQTGLNAFILSIGAGLVISNLYNNRLKKDKVINYIKFILLFVLIFLTDKRGFIIFNSLIVVYIFYRSSEKKLKAILPLGFFLAIFAFILFGTEMGYNLLDSSINSGDITSGRAGMNQLMWQGFIENPIFGQGTYTTMNYIDFTHGHNIYLQVLTEQGLVGFIPLLLFLGGNFYFTDKLIKKNSNNNFIKKELIFSIYIQLLFIFWGFTGNPLYDNFPLYMYFIAIAIVYSIKSKHHYNMGVYYENS